MQIGGFQSWLSKNKNWKGFSNEESTLITAELQSCSVGIRCSNRFTLTYGMLWNASDFSYQFLIEEKSYS